MKELPTESAGEGLCIAVVVSRFHEPITRRLLDGCLSVLRECGVADEDITVAWVPGSFELPTAALWFAERSDTDAVIALGCVLRGETDHHELVAAEAARGIADAARRTGTPVLFGVITADTYEQAVERSGGRIGNRGADAARSAVEMALLKRRVC
jgi:6,7-dimethyl-8-ribityllumazine synthase